MASKSGQLHQRTKNGGKAGLNKVKIKKEIHLIIVDGVPLTLWGISKQLSGSGSNHVCLLVR